MRSLPLLPLLLLLAGCFSDAPTPDPTPTRDPQAWRNFLPAEGGWEAATSAPVNFFVTNGTGPANELVIAVNPKDPLNLIAGGKDYALFARDEDCPASGDGGRYERNVWSGVYVSRDGGRTWRAELMPGHPLDDANASHPNRAWPCNSDPVVVFDQDGKAYYSGLGIRGPLQPDPVHPCVLRNRSIWVMTSEDQGTTWKDFSCVAASNAAAGFVGQVVDKQWFAVDGRYVYFTYMNFNPAGNLDLVLRRSTDGGATWDPETPLHEFDRTEADLRDRQFGMPAIGPAGELYVVWYKFGEGVYFAASSDRGATFGQPGRLLAPVRPYPPEDFGDDLYRVGNLPVIASDRGAGPHAGNLYIVWPDWTGRHADVMFVRSTDGGRSWSAPKVLHEDAWIDGHQFLPWITTSPGGDVHVVWLDSHESGDPEELDVYVRTSLDGGATWAEPLKVNAQRVLTKECFHQNGSNFIGDYIGVAASDMALHPFWPDGRTGRCEGVTATVVR